MAEEQDKGYRLLFSFPRMVEDLIRLFIHGNWIELLDFSTLEKVSERDVSPELLRREKDLLWRLRLRPRAGEPGPGDWFYLYLHFEFQSTVDRFMAIRALSYRTLLWEDLIRQKAFTSSGKLPPVLSVVLYNGSRQWTGATSVLDLIEPLPGSSVEADVLGYRLIDEHGVPAEELVDVDSPVAGLFRMERSATTEDLVREAVNTAHGLPGHDNLRLREALGTWVTYLALPRLAPGLELPQREIDLTEVTSMLEERLVEWTEQWKQEGLEKGLQVGQRRGVQEGRRKGLQEGRQEGEAAVLLRLLTVKYGSLEPGLRDQIRKADAGQLLAWSERFVTATSLAEIFEEPSAD